MAANLVVARRRILGIMFGSIFAGTGNARGTRVSLDVVLFSYLPRPIFEVYLGKTWIGAAGPYPRSGTGTVTDVEIELGVQEVRWRLDGPKGMPGNGDRISAANTVKLDVAPANATYLAVHVYPGNSVELVTSPHYPELSARGQAFDQEWRRTHGKR